MNRRSPGQRSLLVTVLLLAAPISLDAEAPYEQRRASRDGIGKVYMGREIARVMGYQGAGWLERAGRQREERTDLLIASLPLALDSVVADIGAGTGYFSLPIAQLVTEGRVLAVDLQPEMLRLVEQRAVMSGVSNIEMILASETDPGLEPGVVDLALFVDVYHEISHPREVMTGIVEALKPGGLVVLVEYRAEDRSVPIKPLHKMSQRQAKKEMAAVGLTWIDTIDVLPQQHILIFSKADQSAPAESVR